MPYFFLSYASADDDGYLTGFYRDLREAVRSRTGLRADEIGFRDQANLPVGVTWTSELSTALATARVFVAMCSPSYFASEICGREWQMFTELARQRHAAAGGGAGATPANLLPIIWIPSANMPDIARRVQHAHEGLGKLYAREGLQFLARLRRYRDEYQLFVTRLAERIVTVGGTSDPRMPPQVPALEDVPNAFTVGTPAAPSRHRGGRRRRDVDHRGRAGSLGHRQAVAAGAVEAGEVGEEEPSLPGGPRHVHFVVVAAPSYKLGHIRRDMQFYGPTAYDWAPYRPQFHQRVCVFVQNIASTRDLTSTLATAESSIVDLLREAKERNEPVVLIVDVWTTKLDAYRAVLFEYDRLNEPTSAVMVPLNETDEETQERSDELGDDLRRAFPNNTTRGDDVFKTAIPTHESLQDELEQILVVMQSRIFQLGNVRRRAGGDRTVERPVLTRPDEGALR